MDLDCRQNGLYSSWHRFKELQTLRHIVMITSWVAADLLAAPLWCTKCAKKNFPHITPLHSLHELCVFVCYTHKWTRGMQITWRGIQLAIQPVQRWALQAVAQWFCHWLEWLPQLTEFKEKCFPSWVLCCVLSFHSNWAPMEKHSVYTAGKKV